MSAGLIVTLCVLTLICIGAVIWAIKDTRRIQNNYACEVDERNQEIAAKLARLDKYGFAYTCHNVNLTDFALDTVVRLFEEVDVLNSRLKKLETKNNP